MKYSGLNVIYERLKLHVKRKQWRKKNINNTTHMIKYFNSSLVSVGRKTYGGIEVINHSNNYCLKIGSFCSIAPGVLFIVCGEHNVNHISTYPFRVKVLGEEYEASSRGDIIVDDDVWIGARAVILSGVHIGQGAVVAAGAVVSKHVPPYAIVGGVPARILRYRFDKEVIEELLKFDFEALLDEDIISHIDDLNMSEISVEALKKMNWIPHKNDCENLIR